jgi:hypothetical protein
MRSTAELVIEAQSENRAAFAELVRRYQRVSMLIMGTAVRTDDDRYFQLPPLQRTYTLSVGKSVADYSQQMMLDGESPPSIDPVAVDIDGADPGELILISE